MFKRKYFIMINNHHHQVSMSHGVWHEGKARRYEGVSYYFMKSSLTEPEFCLKKLPRKWGKLASTEPKIGFLEFIETFVNFSPFGLY